MSHNDFWLIDSSEHSSLIFNDVVLYIIFCGVTDQSRLLEGVSRKGRAPIDYKKEVMSMNSRFNAVTPHQPQTTSPNLVLCYVTGVFFTPLCKTTLHEKRLFIILLFIPETFKTSRNHNVTCHVRRSLTTALPHWPARIKLKCAVFCTDLPRLDAEYVRGLIELREFLLRSPINARSLSRAEFASGAKICLRNDVRFQPILMFSRSDLTIIAVVFAYFTPCGHFTCVVHIHSEYLIDRYYDKAIH